MRTGDWRDCTITTGKPSLVMGPVEHVLPSFLMGKKKKNSGSSNKCSVKNKYYRFDLYREDFRQSASATQTVCLIP